MLENDDNTIKDDKVKMKFIPTQTNTMITNTKDQQEIAELKRSKMIYSPIFYRYYGERSFE